MFAELVATYLGRDGLPSCSDHPLLVIVLINHESQLGFGQVKSIGVSHCPVALMRPKEGRNTMAKLSNSFILLVPSSIEGTGRQWYDM